MGVVDRIAAVFLVLLAVLTAGPFAGTAVAQDREAVTPPREVPDPEEIPSITAAESIFSDGLRAFEQGRYEIALRRFENVLETYRFNRRTTIALLLAGHSQFHLGRYEEARALYDRLLELYPESRYAEEARSSRDLAAEEARSTDTREHRVLTLGVALPLGGQHRSYTQALFNGIRVAVDGHNTDSTSSLVRMVFADTGARADRARAAVRRLIRRDSVDVIVGPLYSTSEVIPAAEVAERHGVPLIAPMATDVGVTVRREHVFQINPPLATRARRLADLVTDSLTARRLGIVAQLGTDGEQMAKAFQNRLLQTHAVAGEDSVLAAMDTLGRSARAAGPDSLAVQEAPGRPPTAARADRPSGGAPESDSPGTTVGDSLEITFFRLLDSSSDWYRLTGFLDADTLRSMDGIFMPVTGSNAEALADAALGSIARMIPDRARYPRVVGNSVWAGLTSADQGSAFRVTFEESFWEGETTPERVRFERRYRSLSGSSPNRLGYVGYDVARFLIDRLATSDSPRSGLAERIRSTEPFEGVGVRIHFDGRQINQGVIFLEYRGGRIVRLR